MISSWHLMLALLLVSSIAAVLTVLAVRRRALRLAAAEHRADLQTWESEGGGPAARRAAGEPPH